MFKENTIKSPIKHSTFCTWQFLISQMLDSCDDCPFKFSPSKTRGSVFSLQSPELNFVHRLLFGHIFITKWRRLPVERQCPKVKTFILTDALDTNLSNLCPVTHVYISMCICWTHVIDFKALYHLALKYCPLRLLVFLCGPEKCVSLINIWYVVPHCLPVDWLHLSGDAYYRSWRKPVKFLEKVPDVGLVFQVQVKLHYACQTWKKSTTHWLGSIKL